MLLDALVATAAGAGRTVVLDGSAAQALADALATALRRLSLLADLLSEDARDEPGLRIPGAAAHRLVVLALTLPGGPG